MLRLLLSSSIFILFFAGCGSSGNPAISEAGSAEEKEVKKAIKAFTDFYSEKETQSLDELFTEEPQAIVIGIGNDMWKGKQSIKKKMEKAMDDVEDSHIAVRDQVIRVAGHLAWFSQRGDWSYDYKGQRVNLEGVRLTGVLLYDEGKWKITQWHTSYPVRAQ